MRNEKGQFVKGERTGFESNLKLGHGWNKGMKFPERSGKNCSTFTHGMSHTRFWTTYRNINSRCMNKENNRFHIYGGRGIKCLWNNFEEFRDDMYESYQLHIKEFGEKNTSIDRIDVNGHYEKSNCRWATSKEQSRN